eukprot:g7219.t1 g7219   contig24:126932-127354(-)
MEIMQEQLSEYHIMIDQMNALKEHCQKLHDLNSTLREECYKRDYKISALQNEAGVLRSAQLSSSTQQAAPVTVVMGGLTAYQLQQQQEALDAASARRRNNNRSPSPLSNSLRNRDNMEEAYILSNSYDRLSVDDDSMGSS